MRLVITALGVRLGFLCFFHFGPGLKIEYQSDREAEHFARSLVRHEGFTNPYVVDARIPSALRTPLHSLLLAALLAVVHGDEFWFRVSTYPAFSLVSALSVALVYLVGTHQFGRRVGLAAAIAFAAYPPSIYYATNATCDATLVAASLLTLSLTAIALDRDRSRHLTVYGLVAGLAALVNPSTLSVSGPLLIWLVARRRESFWKRMIAASSALAVLILIISPWLVRNYFVFHRPVFLRSNFGMELWGGNRLSGFCHIKRDEFHLDDPVEIAACVTSPIVRLLAMDTSHVIVLSRP